MDKKTICFFNSNRAWGGGEKWHSDSALAFKKKGYCVWVMTNRNSMLYRRLMNENIRIVGIHVTNLSFLNIAKVFRLAGIFKTHQMEAIILNMPTDLKLAGLAAKLAGVKKIIYRRGLAVPIRNHVLNRFLFRHVLTEVIANSEEIKRTILLNNPRLIEEEKIHVVYNGIDIHRHRPGTRPRPDKNARIEVVLGNAGRFVEQKGQRYLMEVADLLKKQGVPFKMLIAGTGKLEKDLKQYAAQLQVSTQTDFIGFVENIEDFMDRIDIFLLTSLHEGSANIVLEAMAYGKPVVAFDISSNREMIADRQSGFLVEFPNISAFAGKVMQLIFNPVLRKQFGAAGRKLVEQKFDATENLRQVMSIIEK